MTTPSGQSSEASNTAGKDYSRSRTTAEEFKRLLDDKKPKDPATVLDGRQTSSKTSKSETSTPAAEKCRQCGDDHATPEMGDGLCFQCRTVERQKADWLRDSGITERHRGFTLDQLQGPPAYMQVKADVAKFLTSGACSVLALIGKRGTGKTQMMSAYIHSLVMQGRRSILVGCTRLLADLKGRYGFQSESADADWLTAWVAPWLLVIDEFAEHLDSDWARIMLTTLIDERYAKMHPTVLLANVGRQQFAPLVGGAVADRCNEGGGVIVCDWPSFRQAKTECDDDV